MAKPYIGDTDAPQGSLYEPQNTVERYSKSIGGMLPYAPVMGAASVPGGLAKASATGLLSEAGGDAAALVGGEKWRPAGNVLGAAASGGRAATKKAPIKFKDPKTFADINTRIYNQLKATPVSPGGASALKGAVRHALTSGGVKYNPKLHKDFSNALSVLDDYVGGYAKGKKMTLDDVSTIRSMFSSLKGGGGTASAQFGQGPLAYHVVNKLDDVVANLKGSKSVKAAVDNYFRKSKTETLEQLANEIQAKKGRFTGTGLEGAVKDTFRKVVTKLDGKSKAAKRYAGQFTPEEKKAARLLATPKAWSAQNIASVTRQFIGNRQAAGLGVGGAAVYSVHQDDPTAFLWASILAGVGQGARLAAGGAANKRFKDFAKQTGLATQAPRRAIDLAQPAIRGVAAYEQGK
jgi:hypothetical protein